MDGRNLQVVATRGFPWPRFSIAESWRWYGSCKGRHQPLYTTTWASTSSPVLKWDTRQASSLCSASLLSGQEILTVAFDFFFLRLFQWDLLVSSILWVCENSYFCSAWLRLKRERVKKSKSSQGHSVGTIYFSLNHIVPGLCHGSVLHNKSSKKYFKSESPELLPFLFL